MKRLIASVSVLFAVIVSDGIVASAQSGQYTCIISNGRKCYVHFDTTGAAIDTICDEGSTGIGVFGGNGRGIPGSGPVNTELFPVSITATITDPTYGTITTELDRERQSSPATLRSADSVNRFPLDVAISFYATASLQSAPGKLLRSRDQLVFGSSGVTSINPFNGESLVLKNNVEFYDPADSKQGTVFALQGGTTRVTLGVKRQEPTYTCILLNGRKCYINFGDNGQPIDTVCDENGTGVGTFRSVTGPFRTDSLPVNTELFPVDITATVIDSAKGAIITRLDPTRTPSASTIRSNGATRFPLAVNINFYATASLPSAPGKLFRSKTQLAFVSTGVRSLDPFTGEVATLKNDVEFVDVADATGHTSFTLQGGRTTITLGTPRKPGPSYNCILINGQKCYVLYDDAGNPTDTICNEGTKGIGTFSSLTGPISRDSAVNTALVPTAISATVQDPTYGTITTTLDASRPSSPTTIRTVPGQVRFPLEVNISFYANATLGSAPGTVYRSRTQLQFFSRNVTSVNPFTNEVLALNEDVEFYDIADPEQRTAFKLQRGRSTVKLSGGIAGVRPNGDMELKLDLR